MTALELLHHPLVAPLGWALVHFLWQGAVVAGLLAMVLRARSPRRASLLATAEARYLAACLALGGMAACPVITMSVSLSRPGHSSPLASPDASALLPLQTAALYERLPASAAPDLTRQAGATAPDLLLPAVVAAWLLGVTALSARLLGGWITVQRLRRRGTRLLQGETGKRFRELARRMGVGRPVVLLESPVVSVPAAIGWLRAAVLVPTSALSGLPPDQLEAVLAHELAHIRRNDYLVNLLQSVVEIVLFYHPAVWWVSGYIRREREHCCDDMAVAVLGGRLTYARALTALEELRQAPPSLAMAADSGDLLTRVRRILGLPPVSSGPSVTGAGGMMMITLILAAVALQAAGATAPASSLEPRAAAPPRLSRPDENRQRQIAEMLPAEEAQRAALKRLMHQAKQAEKAREVKLRHAKLEAERAEKLRRAKLRPARVQPTQRRPQPVRRLTALAPSGAGTTASGSSAANTKAAAPPSRAAAGRAGGVVKGVPGPSIQDVAVLDLRGVPAREVARIRSIMDVAVLLVDERNRGALSGASLEDVTSTVVAGPNARVLIEPVMEFSRATMEAMPARQQLILVGVALFRPDVTPALVTQKLASLNVTGVMLASAGVRGALMGKMQITGASATLPDDAGPAVHSVGANELTTGYLSRLQDRSLYVNIGATTIAPDVTEALLAQKIGTYVNIGATLGPKPLLERLKSISVANFGTFAEGDDDEEDED